MGKQENKRILVLIGLLNVHICVSFTGLPERSPSAPASPNRRYVPASTLSKENLLKSLVSGAPVTKDTQTFIFWPTQENSQNVVSSMSMTYEGRCHHKKIAKWGTGVFLLTTLRLNEAGDGNKRLVPRVGYRHNNYLYVFPHLPSSFLC